METVNLIINWMCYYLHFGLLNLSGTELDLRKTTVKAEENSWRGTAVIWARIDKDVKSAAFGDKLHCGAEEDIGFKDNS